MSDPSSSPSLPSLSSEQEAFVQRLSLGAALLGLVYFFGSRLIEQGFLMLVPFYNIYLYIKGIMHGRRMAWESGRWSNFEDYARRQKYLDRIGLVFVGLIIAFVGMLTFLVFNVTSGAADASNAFFDHVRAGDVHGAYEMTSPDFRQVGDEEQFKGFLERTPLFQSAQNVSIIGRSVNTADGVTEAQVRSKLTNDTNEEVYVTLYLLKQGETWQINDIETSPTDDAEEAEDSP